MNGIKFIHGFKERPDHESLTPSIVKLHEKEGGFAIFMLWKQHWNTF
jgi:hypothetical protein